MHVRVYFRCTALALLIEAAPSAPAGVGHFCGLLRGDTTHYIMKFALLASLAMVYAPALALAPMRSSRPVPRTALQMAAGADSISTLSAYVTSLEAQCTSGDSSSCVMLKQLTSYAQALKDVNDKRRKSPAVVSEQTAGSS